MAEQPVWHEAYPKPRNQQPNAITREELLAKLHQGEKPGVDFLLIDLRRTDHEGGTIKGAINLPAQSLYHSLPTSLNICLSADLQTVIWYCGSSKGRGSRAAGWFEDLIRDRNISNISSLILLDGIAGWAKAGEDYSEMMDEYDAEVWSRSK